MWIHSIPYKPTLIWSEIISSNTRHTPYYSCSCIFSKWLRHFLLDVCYRNSFMVWSSFRSTIHVVLLGLSLSTTVYWALYKFQKLKKQQQQKLRKMTHKFKYKGQQYFLSTEIYKGSKTTSMCKYDSESKGNYSYWKCTLVTKDMRINLRCAWLFRRKLISVMHSKCAGEIL